MDVPTAIEPMAIAGEVRSRARPLAYFLKNRMYLGEPNGRRGLG